MIYLASISVFSGVIIGLVSILSLLEKGYWWWRLQGFN